MKKLHVIKDNSRAYGEYAQVKNNFVYLTNGSVLLKMPAEEVFGKDVIQADDVLYFNLKMWSLFKFHTAKNIWRERDAFKNNHGLTYQPLYGKDLKEMGLVYPDVDCVVPERSKQVTAICKYGINVIEYSNLISAWGVDPFFVRMWFYGEDKGCIIESTESKGFAYLMPLNPTHEKWNDNFESYPQTKVENIDDLL